MRECASGVNQEMRQILLQVTNLINKSAPPVNDDVGYAAPAAPEAQSATSSGYMLTNWADLRGAAICERTISLPPPTLIKSLSSLQDASSVRAASAGTSNGELGMRNVKEAQQVECLRRVGKGSKLNGRNPPATREKGSSRKGREKRTRDRAHFTQNRPPDQANSVSRAD
jgi:hypothetical protein